MSCFEHCTFHLQHFDGRAECPEATQIANKAIFDSPWFSDKNNLAFLRLLITRAGMGKLESYDQLYDIWDTAQAMVKRA